MNSDMNSKSYEFESSNGHSFCADVARRVYFFEKIILKEILKTFCEEL